MNREDQAIVLFCAFRYALGRKTADPSECPCGSSYKPRHLIRVLDHVLRANSHLVK